MQLALPDLIKLYFWPKHFLLVDEGPIQIFLVPFWLVSKVYARILIWLFFIKNILKLLIVFSIWLVIKDRY